MKHPEHLNNPAGEGLIVRSKSEALIVVALRNANIPFRYECAYEINGIDYYPDFTIIKPSTGKTYYWEHFGRMDDHRYVADFYRKIPTYIQNGIIPDDNLIMTFETLKHPLSYDVIQRKIRGFLL